LKRGEIPNAAQPIHERGPKIKSRKDPVTSMDLEAKKIAKRMVQRRNIEEGEKGGHLKPGKGT